MKNLLIITFAILLMGPLQLATAQQKQSDATWRETIDFIDKYKEYVKEISTGGGGKSPYETPVENSLMGFKRFKKNFVRLRIEYDHKYRTPNHDSVWERRDKGFVRIFLSRLKEVRESGNQIDLRLTGNYVDGENTQWTWGVHGRGEVYEPYSGEFTSSWAGLSVTDSEMRQRLLKAFKHLAYLATEYRKAERAASGDAF